MAKRYYWLKLKDDFFAQKVIKKLRKTAGGDTYVIIYLKMQLKAISNDGILKFENLEENFAEELALDLDEDVDNVAITLSYLQKQGLIEQISDSDFLIPEVKENIGSESDSAERKRNQRLREKKEKLKCDNVTLTSQTCHVEKEIEKDIDIDNDRQKENNINNIYIANDFKNLKLVEEIAQDYDEIFKEKEVYIEREFIYLVPKNGIYKTALFQNALKKLKDEKSEYLNCTNKLMLEKVYDKFIKAKQNNEILNDLNYFIESLKNEVLKQEEKKC